MLRLLGRLERRAAPLKCDAVCHYGLSVRRRLEISRIWHSDDASKEEALFRR